MARKRKQKSTKETPALPKIRSTLHQVLAQRKSGKHKRDSENRTAQKLRRELEQD